MKTKPCLIIRSRGHQSALIDPSVQQPLLKEGGLRRLTSAATNSGNCGVESALIEPSHPTSLETEKSLRRLTSGGYDVCSRGRQSALIEASRAKPLEKHKSLRRLTSAATGGGLVRRTLAFALLAVLSGVIVHAQPVRFQITSYTDRGSGTSSGGNFTVMGTAGQSDAAATTSNGRFGLAGGFWREEFPRLDIRRQGNQVILSWPNPSTGFQLQETSALGQSGWASVTATPSVVGASKEVSLTINPGSRGFRLCRP